METLKLISGDFPNSVVVDAHDVAPIAVNSRHPFPFTAYKHTDTEIHVIWGNRLNNRLNNTEISVVNKALENVGEVKFEFSAQLIYMINVDILTVLTGGFGYPCPSANVRVAVCFNSGVKREKIYQHTVAYGKLVIRNKSENFRIVSVGCNVLGDFFLYVRHKCRVKYGHSIVIKEVGLPAI